MVDASAEAGVVALAAQLHAGTARLIEVAVGIDEAGGWASVGMRSCSHWLSVVSGIDLWTAREMLRVGHALRQLPLVRAAFAEGRIAFDKVRALTRVAAVDDEAIWLELALEASVAQLGYVCRAFRRSVAVDDAERAALQRARRRLVSWWLDDEGMLALYATLPPEEGRLVLNAIEAAVIRPTAESVVPGSGGDVVVRAAEPDPAAEPLPENPYAARRADALVRVCERWFSDARDAATPGRPPSQLVVHVDFDTYAGTDSEGRCHLERGPALSVAAARRLGCDATVTALIERNGEPLEVGREQRIVNGRLRRLVQLRDGGCRYPGCAVPAADTECHHVVHWVDGGRTTRRNLISLCRFHHHRYHDGAFRIGAGGERGSRAGSFVFETTDGRPIAPGESHLARTPSVAAVIPGDDSASVPASPRPLSGGERLDRTHAVQVIADCVLLRRRRPPGGASAA